MTEDDPTLAEAMQELELAMWGKLGNTWHAPTLMRVEALVRRWLDALHAAEQRAEAAEQDRERMRQERDRAIADAVRRKELYEGLLRDACQTTGALVGERNRADAAERRATMAEAWCEEWRRKFTAAIESAERKEQDTRVDGSAQPEGRGLPQRATE